MSTVDRQSVLAGAVAASGPAILTPLGTRPAAAAAPLAGMQNVGLYRYKVGTHQVSVVTDGVNRSKFPDGFVANKTRTEGNGGLVAAFLQPVPDMVAIPYTPIVVNTGTKLVVMETGTGEANFERNKGAAGQFHGHKTNLAISRLPIDEAEREALRQKAGNHFNECGCSMGSFFLIAAIAGLIFYLVFFAESIVPPLWSISLLFLAAIAGKLLGMATGKIRLFLLYRRLLMAGALRLQEELSK